MAAKSGKNGKIELFRFGFSVIVMLFHIGQVVWDRKIDLGEFSFFGRGYFGVEFFFIVSGYLMASAAFKNRDSVNKLGAETFGFMERKLFAILPFHLIAYAVVFVGICFLEQYTLDGAMNRFFQALPNLFLVSRSGLPVNDILAVEWYIADMLIAMLILYPLCRKYYDVFSKIAAPAIAIFGLGYLIHTTGSLRGSTAWLNILSKTFVRAVAELCAGVFVFELCRYIKTFKFKKSDKVFLTIIEFVCWAAALYFCVSKEPNKYGGHFFILLCIAVCLAFSEITYGASLFNNKFFCFLGSLSLPLYLFHFIVRSYIRVYMKDFGTLERLLVFLAVSFALSFIFMPVEKALRKVITKKVRQLKGL